MPKERKKVLCMDAQRHVEYYGMQQTFDELYAKSKAGEVFNGLMELVLSPDNIMLAYRNIKTNTGSYTAGTDKQNIGDIGRLPPAEVIDKVRKIVTGSEHGYRPKPVRRKDIPKPNGKTRPLGIPCIWDRLVQQCIKQILEPICEAKFSNNSYGFRPNRSVEHAISRTYSLLQRAHLHYVLEFDIKGFFDNVNHSKLIRQLWALGIQDKQLLFVIKRILKAPIRMPDGSTVYPTKGTPQGGIISPLLANVVLNELDHWVDSQWVEHPVANRYGTHRIIRTSEVFDKSKGYQKMRETNLKEMFIVRYADDFRIFCRNREDAEKTMEAVTRWITERLKLEVSPEKTRIVNVRKRYSEFLGFKIMVYRKANDEKDGKNTPFRDVARAYIDSKKSILDPSVRLEGDYEQHKNKANTTAGKETMLRRICEISPAFAEMPISKVNKRECEKFLDLLGEADVRSVKGYAVLKPNAKQYKKLSCPQIAAQCSIQTKSVERVFRGERTTLKTAQEIAAALKCKPEKLFHIELDHRPIARKTIKEYAIFLRLVMQYAEREYGIDNDTQTLAVKGTRSRPVDCLHPEEVEALFRVLPRCSTLEQVIVMGLLNTGMRRGELAGLTWEDIDFDHCTVHVDKSLLIVNKGYHLTTTKEDNVRDIDVAPEFMEYLKTYRDQWLAQKHRMGSAWQTCMDGKWESYRESLQKLRGKNFIVINDFGWPISPDHYGKIVDRVAEKAGIRKIHPHMFRHTFVSILLSNPDIGVATVAAEAGHAQPSTTLAIYTQVYHKRQDSIRSQMSETLYKRKTPER